MDSSAERLFIVMPAYNEAANIEQVATAWHEVLMRFGGPGSKLLILDDGSKDMTWQLLSDLQGRLPGLMALTRPNKGHGATLRQAYALALEQGADFVFQTDSDGQTVPAEFEQFWQLRNSFSALIGNRVKRGDGWVRFMVSRVLQLLILAIFQVWIPDANTPFRLIERQALARCLDRIPQEFFLTNVLMSILLVHDHLPVKFVPITFHPRQGGKNSINLGKIVIIGFNTLREFVLIRRTMS